MAGDTLDTGALGGVMGSGLAVAHRWAQAQGFRDAGREDLAVAAEAQMMEDTARGAVNGVVRGTTVAPDAVALLREKNRLSEADVQEWRVDDRCSKPSKDRSVNNNTPRSPEPSQPEQSLYITSAVGLSKPCDCIE